MALSGMTGFARVEGSHGAWSWAVEARSVNGRNLETRFRGPPGFEGLDKAALAAVLNPLKSNDLYFVADGTGGHVFASTYEEHERNVAKWRLVEKSKAAAKTSLAGG